MGCYNATSLDASPDEVWSALRNFHDLSWAPNVVEDVEVVGDAGATEVGARRVLNGVFHETLRTLDDGAMHLRYSIDEGPGPLEKGKVEGYVGEVRVVPATPGDGGDRTIVVWTSEWASEEGGVQEFCDPIYRAILTDMKAHFG